jgi:hypothetical protein
LPRCEPKWKPTPWTLPWIVMTFGIGQLRHMKVSAGRWVGGPGAVHPDLDTTADQAKFGQGEAEVLNIAA